MNRKMRLAIILKMVHPKNLLNLRSGWILSIKAIMITINNVRESMRLDRPKL